MNKLDAVIEAARVPQAMPDFQQGMWNGKRRNGGRDGVSNYYALCNVNIAGLHQVDSNGYGGDIVMEDTPTELRRHAPIFVHGRGRILKTGLGLGCVVRGLLTKPDVEHIDVVEIEPVVINHVAPEFSNNPRVTIYEADALTWPINQGWDFVWHDVWCEGNVGLDELHIKLMARFKNHCRQQGAWFFPRQIAARIPSRLLGGKRPKKSDQVRAAKTGGNDEG